MNILPFLHFFAFLVYCSLLIFILWKDRKSLLNRICAGFLACLALWSFGYIFIHIPSTSKDTVILLNNIASVGWIGFASFFLWFALVFTEKKEILKTRIVYPLIFVLPLLLIYKQWTGFLTADYIKYSWGWNNAWSESIWVYLFYFYYLSFTVTGLYLIFNFGRKSEEPLKKKQARIIFITSLVSLILGTLTDVISPVITILKTIPSLPVLIILIWAGGIVFAIVKYRFMALTLFAAAENIISTMADSLILLDEEGKIVAVNRAAQGLSGYRKDELNGRPVDLFFPGKDFYHTLLAKSLNKDNTRNWELTLKTETGEDIPVLFSSSVIIKKGFIAGIVCIIKDITERKKVEDALKKSQQKFASLYKNLKESEQKFKTITEGSADAIFISDQQGNYVYVNPAATEMLGYSLNEMTHMNIKDISQPGQIEEDNKKFQRILKKEKIFEELHLVRKDGSFFLADLHALLLPNGFIYGSCRDITERKKLEEALYRSQQEFVSLFQSNPEATLYTDQKGNILNINTRFTERFGYTLEEIKGKNIDAGLIQPPEKINEAQELTKKGLNKEYFGVETIRKKKDGTLFPVYISSSPVIIKGKQKGVIGTYYDITERKKIEKQLEKLTRTDSLTGCYNRRYCLELLDRQMKLSRRSQSHILLAFLDIDKFKTINDTFGHDEGDRVLKEAVGLFKSTLREVDIICRMGGDEFLLIFPDSSLQEASLIRNRLEEELLQLNREIKKDYNIQFSMGFSEYVPEKPKSLNELIAIADQRMYEEKKKNKEK